MHDSWYDDDGGPPEISGDPPFVVTSTMGGVSELTERFLADGFVRLPGAVPVATAHPDEPDDAGWARH